MFCTCYSSWVKRESLAHAFLDLRLREFCSRPECEYPRLQKGVMIMFSWGLAAGSRRLIDGLECRFLGKGLCPSVDELEGLSRLVTPGSSCIPTWGHLVVGIGDSSSALLSVGRSAWHKYLVNLIRLGSLALDGKDRSCNLFHF